MDVIHHINVWNSYLKDYYIICDNPHEYSDEEEYYSELAKVYNVRSSMFEINNRHELLTEYISGLKFTYFSITEEDGSVACSITLPDECKFRFYFYVSDNDTYYEEPNHNYTVYLNDYCFDHVLTHIINEYCHTKGKLTKRAV